MPQRPPCAAPGKQAEANSGGIEARESKYGPSSASAAVQSRSSGATTTSFDVADRKQDKRERGAKPDIISSAGSPK